MRTTLLLLATGLFGHGLAMAGEPSARLTPAELDRLVAQELNSPVLPLTTDEHFLRRVSLDLIGRPPTPAELADFMQDTAPDKRAKIIDQLLASPEFGRNWANYWSDTISYHVPPPELTFLSYRPLKKWLAEQFNAGQSWDRVVTELLTASGTVKENPAATFVGFHQGKAEKLAAETARIFLGLQLQCAECHDHPFDVWERPQFHQLAAFFARTSAKLGSLDGSTTIVKDKGKGEHVMANLADPGKKGETMAPLFLEGNGPGIDKGDAERRAFLAKVLTAADNPWFAKAYVNRIWARLMGRGFYEPVDDLSFRNKPILPDVHEALSASFVASGFDIKELFRLVLNTRAYQAAAVPSKLRGDEVFDSLVNALGLPNVTPPPVKPTAEIRFPPPPKSTGEMVAEKFGFDPSLTREEVSRTMGQAMLLMNNEQIQAQINADPQSGTRLSKLLKEFADDREAVVQLFRQVLARTPTEKEIGIALEHVKAVGQRGEAFEDLLWSLVNSAEFASRR